MSKILLPLLVVLISISVQAQKKETVFDRKKNIVDTLMPVPVVPRHEEALGIQGQFMLVGDVNLWVERLGEGTPLVLVSGGPGTSHHYFHPHFQEFTKFSNVIYYDMRGVGLSERIAGEDGYNIEQSVDDLEGLRQKLGHEKWVVLGLSFGGMIAQYYAYKYPEHTQGMILLSSALPMSINVGMGSRQYEFLSPEEIKRIGEIYNVGGRRTPPVHSDVVSADLQRQMLYNAFSNGDWKRRHLTRWYTEDISTYSRYEFVHDKNYYGQMFRDYFNFDFKNVFKESPIPTLIIEGKWDMAFSAEKADLMFEQFPTAQHLYMENSGHLPFEDEPDKFREAIRDFMANLDMVTEKDIQEWQNAIQSIDIHVSNQVQMPPQFRSR